MKQITLFFTIVFLICYQPCYSDYNSSELFVISWGEGESELISSPSAASVDPGTPEDPTDDFFLTGNGPHEAFVDSDGIIVLISQNYQLKGFNEEGDLIFDFSGESPDFIEGMFRGDLGEVYLDDNKHIYLTAAWPMPYVPIINYESFNVDSLRPFIESPDEPITDMNWGYDGRIMFFSDNLGWITHNEAGTQSGGTWGVLLADGRNYGASFIGLDTVKIYSTIEPDIWGHGTDKDTSIINLGVNDVVWVEVLKSMEQTHIYLIISYSTNSVYYEVWQFDLDYNLIDKIIPPDEPQYYTSAPKPFITAKGDIYEFRTREDGLHIIRWSKE